MKLIRCNECNDVVRLVHTGWRKCDCGESGGQYNDDLLSATVGGNCEVIGIRNDFFEESREDRVIKEIDRIIQGEYDGDVQIHRIKSPDGPKLKMALERDGDIVNVTFTDDREYTINLIGDKSPKMVQIPYNDTPSFRDEKTRKALKK